METFFISKVSALFFLQLKLNGLITNNKNGNYFLRKCFQIVFFQEFTMTDCLLILLMMLLIVYFKA